MGQGIQPEECRVSLSNEPETLCNLINYFLMDNAMQICDHVMLMVK